MSKVCFIKSGRPYGYCCKCGNKKSLHYLKTTEYGDFICEKCKLVDGVAKGLMAYIPTK